LDEAANAEKAGLVEAKVAIIMIVTA